MRTLSKTRIVAAVFTMTLIAAFAFSSVSPTFAQTETPTPAPTQPGTPRPTGGSRGNGALAQAGIQLAKAILDATVQTVGINESEILKALADGKSIKDIVTANNADLAQLKALAKQTLTDDINKANITPAQKGRLLANLDSIIDRAVNGQFNFRGNGGAANSQIQRALLRAGGTMLLVQETSKATAISQRDLLQMLRDNKTLAQIANAHNADVAAIVSAAVAQSTTRINRLVKANRISQAQADQLLAALPGEYTKLMNETNPFKYSADPSAPNGDQPATPVPATPKGPATPSL